MADPHNSLNFLEMTSSVYPGFHSANTLGSLILGTIERILDGAIAGLVLSRLDNAFTQARTPA